MRSSLALAACLGLVACAPPSLKERVDALEAQVAAMQEAQQAPPRQQRPDPAVSAEREQAANALFQEATEAHHANRLEEAKELLARLRSDYGDTRVARRAERLTNELAVIGRPAGAIEVNFWFQGEAAMDDGKATLLLFWEEWCPHCKRAMPELESTWQTWGPQGLNVVALTKVTRSSIDESVRAYIEEVGLSYPVGKERPDAGMSNRFAVRGIPAAAVVKDGVVVWRGHPARIDDAMIEAWLAD